MKKALFTLLAVFSVFVTEAQNFSQGNSLINADYGFSMFSRVKFSTSGMETKTKTIIPPVGLSYEYALRDNFTVGGFAAYANQQIISTITDPWDPSDETKITNDYKFIYVGALANYHFGFIDIDKLNLYAGVKLGYTIVNQSTTTEGDSDLPDNLFDIKINSLLYGIHLGGRYFFTENLAANLTLGYGISLVAIGLTYKIGY